MNSSLTSTDRVTADIGVTFGVLGPLEVRAGGRLVTVPGRQERALLAMLLTAPGRVFSVATIVAGLWEDEAPAAADKTVQSYVSRLRRALPGDGASPVITRSPGYVAAVDPATVDAERFRSLAGSGRRALGAGRPAQAAEELRNALALWRGEAYAEFDAPFAVAGRAAMEELRLAALEDRIAADLAMGAGPELIAELEEQLGRHPWRERFWAQLMTALYRSGRQADALRAFGRARASLVDELGVEPGPELQAVQQQVLGQDARLLGGDQPHWLPTSTLPGPAFVGRTAELARLVQAYERAAAGAVQSILVTGPHGIGKTRLIAELAREAQARGALVHNHMPTERPAGPVVVLLDDLHRASTADLTSLAERLLAAHPPMLVVGAGVLDDTAEHRATVSRTFPDQLAVPPLPTEDVASIVRLYVPSDAVVDGVRAVARAGGVPLQVHAEASRFGDERAAAQVEEAAASLPAPQRHVSESQERVTEGIRDRQRIRLLRSAHRPAGTPTVVCPYKGLAYFDVDDAPYFFGRERLVAQLVARLVDARSLAVVGASGSGKSSAVRAGLVAAVRTGMLPGSERWQTVLTTPGKPRPELAPAGTRSLLVVDQFEELFTALSPAQRDEYAGWLADMADRDDVTVVVALRSDYYAQAAAQPGVADLLTADTVLVGEMSREELQQAVQLPAIASGLALEPGLAETIADDVTGQPGGLPLMSTALLSLWEQHAGHELTLATYHRMGGVQTAVSRLAETAYWRLTTAQQSLARRILLRMAETGENGEPVRRRVLIDEVAPERDADARTVLDALAARRLLTVSETHAEVAHEALLREWPRLRNWLAEDEAGRQLRRHLAPAARDWQAGDREDSELYRGPRLAAALDWQRDHPDELTAVEHDFLYASHDAADREAVRRRRSIRRLRVLAVGLAGVLALALVAGVLFVNQRNRADVRALQAAALGEDRWDRALLLAAQAQRFDDSAQSRAALLQTIQRGPEATAMFTTGQALHSLVVSADGRRIVAGGSNGAVFVVDTDTRDVVTVPGVTSFEADQIDLSPDGRYIAAVTSPPESRAQGLLDWQLAVVDLEQSPPEVRFIPHETRGGPRFMADSRTIIDIHGDGQVHYLDVETGQVQRSLTISALGDSFSFLALSGPDDRRFVLAEALTEGAVAAFEVGSGRQIWSTTEGEPLVAAISPDGSRIVVAHSDGQVERIDIRTGAGTAISPAVEEGLIDLTWASDGSTFAGATQDRAVLVWDAVTLEVDAVRRGHWGPLDRLAYAPDGLTMYAAGLDGTVIAWDLTGDRGAVHDVAPRPAGAVSSEALAADGSALALGFENDEGAAWVDVTEIPGGHTFRIDVPIRERNVWYLVPDASGRTFLLVVKEGRSIENYRRVWVYTIDVRRGELLPDPIELPYKTGGDAVLTWEGNAVLSAGEEKVGLWPLGTGRPIDDDVYDAASHVDFLAIHPDGRLAALSGGRLIEVIDVRTGELVRPLAHDESIGMGVVFSPDGRWLAGATSSGRVTVWDTRTWREHATWQAVPGFGVDSMLFTPDSDYLVTGGAGLAAIWTVELGGVGGVQLEVDTSRRDARVKVGVTDNGNTLVTFTAGTGLREWDVSPEGLLEHACSLVGRNLSEQEWADVLPDRPYERTCPASPPAGGRRAGPG